VNRVENYTNIQFTNEEIQLLSKGLKYNLHHKHKKWIETLALEAETAISQLDATEQNYYRHAVAENLKNMGRSKNITCKKDRAEWKLITNIKKKMTTNKLIITKADKGKTLIILTQEEYKQKTKTYIENNQFITINNNPTKCYQKEVKQALKQCVNLIQKEKVWKYKT
jgi:hypothetical protein